MSESRSVEHRVRRHLKSIGFRLHKDGAVIRSTLHQGKYMVATPTGYPLMGRGYSATLAEVETWIITSQDMEARYNDGIEGKHP